MDRIYTRDIALRIKKACLLTRLFYILKRPKRPPRCKCDNRTNHISTCFQRMLQDPLKPMLITKKTLLILITSVF